MPRLLVSGCLSGVLTASGAALAQVKPSDIHEHGAVACIESPTPGKRPSTADCAILLQKKFSSLPPGPLVWRFENFPTVKAAQGASTAASVVVEAAGKVWLLTLAEKGGRSNSGTFVAETELFPPIPPGPSYNIVVAEADLGPEANVMTHKHSGPETWYLLSGEQCLELPDRALRARAGGTMSAPAETPMKLNIAGPGKRDALFLVVHDSSKPFNTFLDWNPKGLCQK
jgi:quercetin dioxygenase-like cupin family protein